MTVLLWRVMHIQQYLAIRSCYLVCTALFCKRCHASLQWRHNERDGVSNHQPHDCLLKRLFTRRSNKTSKLRITGLCEGNSPLTAEFPSKGASNAENASICRRHDVVIWFVLSWYSTIIVVPYMQRYIPSTDYPQVYLIGTEESTRYCPISREGYTPPWKSLLFLYDVELHGGHAKFYQSFQPI